MLLILPFKKRTCKMRYIFYPLHSRLHRFFSWLFQNEQYFYSGRTEKSIIYSIENRREKAWEITYTVK